MTRLVTQITTPYAIKACNEHRALVLQQDALTRSVSSINDTIRNAHSAAGMTSGCFLYNRTNVNAAFFRTKFCDVLHNENLSLPHRTYDRGGDCTYGEMSNRCTSSARASAIS